MSDQDQTGLGWTVVLRRQPVRIVEGRAEGGYTDAYELVCCECGDHPDMDSREISPELQQIRGPYQFAVGIAAYQRHVSRCHRRQGDHHSGPAGARGTGSPHLGESFPVTETWLASNRETAEMGAAIWQLQPRTGTPSTRRRCGAGT